MNNLSTTRAAWRALLFVLLLSFSSTAAQAKHPAYVYSTSDDGMVCIYDSPSTDGGLLGYLITDGKGALFMGKVGDWDKVNFYGQTGYVPDNQVTLGNAKLNGKKPHATKGRQHLSKLKTVYYVVAGSYEDRDNAIEVAQQMSEVLFYDVYEATANGKKVYRLCSGAYKTKAAAQKALEEFKKFLSIDWWIWPSKGMAKCVYIYPSPAGDEDAVVDFPHTPSK